ncbi:MULTISPECIES: hypothetical protein [Lactococcus]|uniref:hypothetical protein n=1 Tax=Lactococcus TaxID=1357 RepID=UPI001F0508F7|nr:hypothetical protein [Lactococcus petauri]MCH1712619.1 hypothetical protein [Lactococcus petauri]
MHEELSKLHELVSKFGVYHESVPGGALQPVSLFWNSFSGMVVDLPFQLLQWFVEVVGGLSSLLNISSSLKPIQADMMGKARTMFLSFIGGSNGTIAQFSGAGLLLIITTMYLFYQFTNGKGHFMRSLFHLLAVIATMFFFFGNFSYNAEGSGRKTAMGGQILFDTVTNTSDKVKNGIESGLVGLADPDDANFLVDYVLKPTANTVNTGNPEGKIGDTNEKFDYEAAAGKKEGSNGKKGQKYVDAVSKDSPFLKNEGKNIGFQFIATFMGGINLWIYVIPISAVNLTISGLSLLLCVFILLIPVSALLSFVPWCRNAFWGVLKHVSGLLAAPSILGVTLSILFYIMSQVDLIVLKLMTGGASKSLLTGVSALTGSEFLIFIPVVVLIKIGFMVMLWKSRTSITQIAMGQNNGSAFVNDLNQMKNQARNKVEGAVEAGAGAYTGNPSLAMDGAQKLAPENEEVNASNNQEQAVKPEMKTETEEAVEFEQEPEDGFELEDDNINLEESLDSAEEQELENMDVENPQDLDLSDSTVETEGENNIQDEGDTTSESEVTEVQEEVFIEPEEMTQNDEVEFDTQEHVTWEEAQSDLEAMRA